MESFLVNELSWLNCLGQNLCPFLACVETIHKFSVALCFRKTLDVLLNFVPQQYCVLGKQNFRFCDCIWLNLLINFKLILVRDLLHFFGPVLA